MEIESTLGFLVPIILPLLSAISATVLGILGSYLLKLRAKVKSEVLGKALEVVGGVALTAVADVMEGSVRHLKAASDDGKLTSQEAVDAFKTATKGAWKALSEEVREVLTRQAGNQDAAMKTYIEPSINRAVLEAKTRFDVTLSKERTNVSAAQLNRARQFLNHAGR